MALVELITNALGGGVLGAAGAVVEKVVMKRLELKQKQAEWDHIRQMHSLQMQADAQQAEQGLLLAQTEGDYQGLVESIKHDASMKVDSALPLLEPQTDLHPYLQVIRMCLGVFIVLLQTLVNAIRALFRPFLTIYLLILATQDAVFVGVASACVFWWIGSRGTASEQRKLK